MSTSFTRDYTPSIGHLAVASVLCGIVALLLLALVPAITHDLGPATITARGELGPGRTVLTIPPLGKIVASTHNSPIRLELSVTTVDLERLGSLATTPVGRSDLLEEVEADLRSLVVRSSLQLLMGGAVIGALLAMLIWHRRWKWVAAGAIGGIVAVALSLAAAGITYDVNAFEEPRYTGTIARAPVVIETLRERASVLDELRSRYETATQRISGLLVLLAEPDLDPRSAATAVLHVSDVHANPVGLQITAELVRAFDVAAVIDTGDISSAELDTGELSSLAGPIDRTIAREVAAIGVPYLFVPGNHDSFGIRDTMSGIDNVVVLNGDEFALEDIEILGWADPTFSTRPTPEDEKEQIRIDDAPEVAGRVRLLLPDVLAVHDERLAAESYGLVPLILAGHTHERDLREENGTLVLTVGSTGATGLKTFTVETGRPYEAEILYFRNERLVALDYVSFEGIGADFELERKTFEEPEDEAFLEPTPTP